MYRIYLARIMVCRHIVMYERGSNIQHNDIMVVVIIMLLTSAGGTSIGGLMGKLIIYKIGHNSDLLLVTFVLHNDEEYGNLY